jgi:predicted nucleic acid-binding protein
MRNWGFRQKDAAHVACAEYSKAGHFLTTDRKILNKPVTAVKLINPIDFIRRDYDAR